MTAKDKTYPIKWAVSSRRNHIESDMRYAGMKDRKDFEARMFKELEENGSMEMFKTLHEFFGVTPILEIYVFNRYYKYSTDTSIEFRIYFRGKRDETCVVTPPFHSYSYMVKALSRELYSEHTAKEWSSRVKDFIFGLSSYKFTVGRKTVTIPDFKSPAELRMKLQLATGRTEKT